MATTASSVTRPPASVCAIAWSSSESPSRTDPSAARAISASAPVSALTLSFRAMAEKWSMRSAAGTRRRSKRWQRDSTVTGTSSRIGSGKKRI